MISFNFRYFNVTICVCKGGEGCQRECDRERCQGRAGARCSQLLRDAAVRHTGGSHPHRRSTHAGGSVGTGSSAGTLQHV